MKPFSDLTRRGQLRRLRQMAVQALTRYDLNVDRIELLGAYTNVLFRVRTSEGISYVLRICTPGWRTETDIRSEVIWLQALTDEPEIRAPWPVATRDGQTVIHVAVPGVPEPRLCLLMSWQPGVSLEKRLDAENVARHGTLFARLHQQAAHFEPPPGFTQLRMDHYLGRGEDRVLFRPETLDLIGDRERATLRLSNERVLTAFGRLYTDPSGMRVIHNDLWHGNVNVSRAKLYPLDFEDTIWGYPVQDLAMALQDVMDDVTPERYEPLLSAMRQGYETMSPWPEAYEGEIDAFRAGRMLWVANYVASHQRQHLVEHVEKIAPVLERWLETGRLRIQD